MTFINSLLYLIFKYLPNNQTDFLTALITMNSYIMDNNIKNVNAYFITDGDCTETYEEIRAFCQEHHRQYQDANVTLKISALGIGNDVKTECLQEIIKIGSQRGFYDIFSEDDPLIHERVQTIIS
jgi:viroplasmin and RNaseH domain-containing protein